MRKTLFLFAGILLLTMAGVCYGWYVDDKGKTVVEQKDVDVTSRETDRSFREEAEEKMRLVEIGGIDLSRIPDGAYVGEDVEFDGSRIAVEVTVLDHRMVDIKVTEARDNAYAEMAKGVIKDVLRKQSLEVDAVTGATVTSKAILRAIENALTELKTAEPE